MCSVDKNGGHVIRMYIQGGYITIKLQTSHRNDQSRQGSELTFNKSSDDPHVTIKLVCNSLYFVYTDTINVHTHANTQTRQPAGIGRTYACLWGCC